MSRLRDKGLRAALSALIAWLLLKERVVGLRLVAAGGIAAGAILLRLS